MDDLLHRLEQKIRELLEQHNRLQYSNHKLNQGKSVLLREKDSLLAKQQKAISQIEHLVEKLKSIDEISYHIKRDNEP